VAPSDLLRKAITGLSATIDYYDIQLEDTIGWLRPRDILRQCAYSFRDGLRLTLGVNNILDRDPQIAPGVDANDYGPGFHGDYDPLGRTLYASLQVEF
jgi:hypothetical protein